MNRDIIAFTKYKFNVYGNKDIRSGKDSAVVGIVGKSKSLDFPTMLIFWSLVRNSVVLAVYLLFSVACFLTVHEHSLGGYHSAMEERQLQNYLQYVNETVYDSLTRWYFGHWHRDQEFGEKFRVIYLDLVDMETGKKIW